VSTSAAYASLASASPRASGRAVAAWLLVCCVLVFAMVVVGGVTRLTHSGLSIVEWQPIVGTLPPLDEGQWQATFDKYKLTPENAARRLKLLSASDEAFKLYKALEPKPDDLYVRKIKFSALVGESSDLDKVLRGHGIEILLIAGTKTNVCCESTARDASMMEYRVAMLSDANATLTDEDHAAALNGFQVSFGDVMTVDEALARLAPAAKRSAA